MLICLSASHKNSSFDVLERLSVGADDAAAGILERHPALVGAVVVATCNRFEAYLDLDEPTGTSPLSAVRAAIDGVSASTGVAAEVLRDTLELVHGNTVAEHLFAVTSGLESVVVGEGEIAGQVRRSLEQARQVGTTSPELERLFQRASQTSRGIKNRTGLGAAGRSLVRLALELAESRIPDWTETQVLLVGTGRYAGASLAALRDLGAENVRVYSPSGRARKFASSHQITAVAESDFAVAAASADLILTCTTVEHHVITAALLRAGLAQGEAPADAAPPATVCPVGEMPGSSLSPEAPAPQRLIIDLGLPRNVDPDVTELAGVELLDLETIRIHAPLEELNATSDARLLVGRAARKFSAVAEEQSLAPAVVALRSHIFGILDAEIERARHRSDSSEQTEAALRHLASVLLHTPMVRSRELARAGEQAAFLTGLDAMFGIQVDLPAVSGTPGDVEISPAAS
ncbi:glutamyl-tRNA reductase [Cryobacterium mannosilyticum]|uniref:Glutamyl-tRNA reductase n=1 Tax=Cryobacterium mannosilyticum TaxID=1259190 RepID=A0A4R8WEX9_9MICO|nr:glutamyl-tRNA reductase [Cryobacterium mannosilyticum]TFC05324.1 glutamyl-tRNA reductase [Cryobacterium mannosilyticum]